MSDVGVDVRSGENTAKKETGTAGGEERAGAKVLGRVKLSVRGTVGRKSNGLKREGRVCILFNPRQMRRMKRSDRDCRLTCLGRTVTRLSKSTPAYM